MTIRQVFTALVAAACLLVLLVGCNGSAPGLNPAIQIKVNDSDRWGSIRPGDSVKLTAEVVYNTDIDQIKSIKWSQPLTSPGHFSTDNSLISVWQVNSNIAVLTTVTLSVTIKTLQRGETTANVVLQIAPANQFASVKIRVNDNDSWSSFGQNQTLTVESIPTIEADDSVVSTEWSTLPVNFGTFAAPFTSKTSWTSPTLVDPINDKLEGDLKVKITTFKGYVVEATAHMIIAANNHAGIRLQVNNSDTWGLFSPNQQLKLTAVPTLETGDSVKTTTWSSDLGFGSFMSNPSNSLTNSWIAPATEDFSGKDLKIKITTTNGYVAEATVKVMIVSTARAKVDLQVNGLATWNTFKPGQNINLLAVPTLDDGDQVTKVKWENTFGSTFKLNPLTITNSLTNSIVAPPINLTEGQIIVTITTKYGATAVTSANINVASSQITGVQLKVNDSLTWGTFGYGQTLQLVAVPTLVVGDQVVKTEWTSVPNAGTFLGVAENSLNNSWLTPNVPTETDLTVKITTLSGYTATALGHVIVKSDSVINPVVTIQVNGSNNWLNNIEAGSTVVLTSTVNVAPTDSIIKTKWSMTPTMGSLLFDAPIALSNSWLTPSSIAVDTPIDVTFHVETKLGGTTDLTCRIILVPRSNLPVYIFDPSLFTLGSTNVTQGNLIQLKGKVQIKGITISDPADVVNYDPFLTYEWKGIFDNTEVFDHPTLQSPGWTATTAGFHYLKVTVKNKDNLSSTNNIVLNVIAPP